MSISVETPCVAIKQSYDCRISKMGISLLKRQFYIESGPWNPYSTLDITYGVMKMWIHELSAERIMFQNLKNAVR